MLKATLKNAMAQRGWSGFSGVVKVLYLYIFRAWFWPVCAESLPSNLSPFFRRLQGAKVGKGVFIDRSVILDGIHAELITIGDDVRLAPGSIVYCHAKAGDVLSEYLPDLVAPVVIKDHAFIGLNAIVMPGVTVGEGAVLTCGSVALASIPDYSLAAGNPARVIRSLKGNNGKTE